MIVLDYATKSDLKNIKNLYNSAFPPEERPPFYFIKKRYLQGRAELLSAKESGHFVGFCYVVTFEKFAYLYFLAVAENSRGQGVGTKILSLVREKYSDKCVFLAREQLDTEAENHAERVSRRDFYLKNGFSDTTLQIKEGSVLFDVMANGELTPDGYDKLIKRWAGRFLTKLIGFSITDESEKN